MEYRLMRQTDTYYPAISEATAKELLTKYFVAWTNPAENIVYIRDYKMVDGKAVSLKPVKNN